jgi:cysteine desulfurase/selenocysteine lyase
MPILNLQKKKKFKVDKIILDENYKVDIIDFKNKLKTNVKIVVLQHVSNITGSINNLKEIVSICNEKNILIVSDGSQMIGHRKVDLKDIGVDVYFFSGHKMLAPTGTGVLYIKKSLLSKLDPIFFGGGTVKEISETDFILRGDIKKYEPGTQNIAGVIGLGAAISYLEKIGLEKIEKEINSLTFYLLESLRKLDFVKIYTVSDIEKNIGIVSFTLFGVHSHDVSFILNEKGIMTRSGFFCSEVFVKKITNDSLIRISLAFYNKKEDIDFLITSLKEIKKRFN